MKTSFTYFLFLVLAGLIMACSSQQDQVALKELPEAVIEQVNNSSHDTIFSQEDLFDGNKIVRSADDTYSIHDKNGNLRFSDLRFAKSISWEFAQILDQQGKIKLLNGELEQVEKAETPYGFCGTVPHYTMAIIEDGNDWVITADETFFDHDQKIPPKEIGRYSKENVDHLEFISGTHEFRYDSNFGIGATIPLEPRTVLARKNDKWAIPNYSREYSDEQFKEFHSNELSFIFDSVSILSNAIQTKIGDLYGYHGICTPKYTVLSPFDHHLARFELPNGLTGFISTDGIEYLDQDL
ncbi:MAG: hypothetical protein HKN39_03470 [Flavobacteriales bacterium]|nr:hypothetical protein [Flavobacteriales bacterium]